MAVIVCGIEIAFSDYIPCGYMLTTTLDVFQLRSIESMHIR